MSVHDQASGLRRLLGQTPTRVVTVVADPTLRDQIMINFVQALVEDGERVALIDENNSLAAAFGLSARHELAHCLRGDAAAERAVLRASEQIAVLPAARGLAQLRERSATPAKEIAALFARVAYTPSIVLCAAAPLSARRTHVGLVGESEVMLVASAHADGVTAAYTQLKALVRDSALESCHVLVARAKSEDAARAAFDNMADAAERFLNLRLSYCGFVSGTGARRGATARRIYQRIVAEFGDARAASSSSCARSSCRDATRGAFA
jgi:flagellar biosynthesis protein FlhG